MTDRDAVRAAAERLLMNTAGWLPGNVSNDLRLICRAVLDDSAEAMCQCGHDRGDHHFGCEALPNEGCPCTAIYPDD